MIFKVEIVANADPVSLPIEDIEPDDLQSEQSQDGKEESEGA